jgi:hypothetical protein
MTFNVTYMYVCSLKIDNSHMYATIKENLCMPKMTLPTQGLGKETQRQSEIKAIKKHATQKLRKIERNEGENQPIPPKRDLPQWSL